MNYKKIYSAFLTLLLALSLIPQSMTRAASFNLTATPECGFIMLKWDSVPDAVRYYVYRGPGEGQEYPMPLTDFAITETFYKDTTDLEVNKKYCYFIKAVDKNDKEFLQSIEACAVMTCQDETPEPPEIGKEDCKMILKYQVGNPYYYNNEVQKGPMDATPIIEENRVNLMARYLAVETGAEVGWDGTTRTVSIKTQDGVLIEMQIGNPMAKINGIPTPIDPNNKKVFPFIRNGRTYTGLRFISYNLGATGPDDIVWQATSKTAVLIFKDPHCKWVCGCIRKLPPSSLTNNIPQYGFFENCNSDKPLYTKIPMDMKDRVLKLSFLEYMKKYPNQDYWCVELRVDSNGNVVGWRARPDQYPNCCKPKPPTDCKWVCGCVQKWTEAPNGNISIFFSKECKDNTDLLSFIVPLTLKDTNLGITWLEYFRKYANQKYWCLEICIGPNNKVVAWKATPEKYPNCCETVPTECKWVPGYITKAVQTPGTTLWTVSFAVNCKEQQMVDLQIDGTLLDMNLSILLADYIKKYPDHKYWCVEFCIDANRKIVKWKATPEKYPNCCEEVPVDCKWVCGCILKAGPNAASNMWYIAFSPNCDTTNVIDFQMSPTLVDANLNITIADYIKKYTDVKYWCVELCIDANKKIVMWKATPEKYPNCCETVPVKKICACIVRMTIQPDVNGMYQVYIKKDCDPTTTPAYDLVLNFPATLLDTNLGMNALDYYNSIPGDPPKMCCIEVAFNSSMVVTQWSAHPDRTPCCEITDKGRILAYIPTKCIEGTTFVVTDLQGVVVWKGQATNEGILDTGCVLKCPEKYRITPYNEKCKFNPEFQDVYVPCCPDKAEVKFDCDCGQTQEKGGRIKGNVSGNCNPGTVVTIYDSAGTVAWTGTTDTAGNYDTGTKCILKCGGTYKVVLTSATGSTCTYYPPSREVIIKNCCPESTTNPGFERADFKCDCEQTQEKGGRIKGTVYGNCNPGTVVTIYDSAGTVAWTGTTDTAGNYDTGTKCILKCGGTYKVVLSSATGTECVFSPPSQEVTIKNCCPESATNVGYERVDFKCECKQQGGRIVAYFPKQCIEGTKVIITDLAGTVVWSGTPNDNGMIDTGCKLKCTAGYTITPKNEKCKFNPEYKDVKVLCCPEVTKVEFGCDCEKPKGRILGTVGRECAGAVISMVKVSNQREQVFTFKTDATGAFDTECMLECGATYTVTPTKEGCTFSPASTKVTINSCCPNGYEKVDFKCDCTPQAGRIVASFSRECIEGTKVVITDMAGTVVWSGGLNANGMVDTDCKLKCPAAYRVTPKNEKCKFYPEYIDVKVPCCPEYAKVEFKCECAQPERKGRIVGSVFGNCGENTMVVIYDEAGTSVWYGPTNANGYFETSAEGKPCVIKCPGSYKVVPSKQGCRFSPESVSVTLSERMCCDNDYVARVDFKCSCEGKPLSNQPKQTDKVFSEKINYLSNDPEALKIV